MDDVNDDLSSEDVDIQIKVKEVENLLADAQNKIDVGKNKRIEDAQKVIDALNNKLDDTEDQRKDTLAKLNQYKKMIADAKGQLGSNDPESSG